jgi:hypothetical protein
MPTYSASQLLIVHGINYVRQTEIHADEPLVPRLGLSEVEIAAGNLKR